jgi:hypothetical protein
MSKTWTRAELALLKKISRPDRAQDFLDETPYRCEDGYFAPLSSIRDGRAHCFDGALIAAAALRRGGYKVFLVDLCATNDDDHILCGFESHGAIGAVAKSNFPGLRFREPIFRSVRELVLSYFEFYFSLDGNKSLRAFGGPVALPDVRRLDWETRDECAERLLDPIERAPHYDILKPKQKRRLRPIDDRLFESQMVGVNRKGAYGG